MSNDFSGKLEDWQRLVALRKTVFSWPSWVDASMYRESRKQATELGRLPLQSDLAARSEMFINVADEHQIAIEDVRIRLLVWKNRPMEDITATFEIHDAVRWICVSRIDFVPPSGHANKFWRKYGLDPEVNTSHIHSCEDNVKLGAEAFAPLGNLPNARALDKEPESFKELCRLVGEHFNITDLQDLPAPDWNWRLRYD